MAKRVMSPPTAGDTEPEETVLMKGKEDANREQEFYLDSPSKGGFIAYEREDNWSDHPYDKRYLDALARVLLVSDKKVNPASAITQVGDRYYLAYNDAKKDNFYKNYKDKLLEILGCLNTKNWQKLLALHILHNRVDFLDILETDARFPGESIGLQDLRANLVKGIEVVDATRQAVVLIEKQLKTIEKDSAQLVAVQTIRAHLQQTTTTPAYESYIDLVASLVLKAQSEEGRCATSSSDKLIEHILRPLQDVVKLKSYIEQKLPEPKLELKLDEKSDGNLIFLDSVTARIKEVVAKEDDKDDVVHAEVRLAHYLGKKLPGVEGFYIGVSKLCCAGCHKVLGDSQYEHRGTSGIFFPDWKCTDKAIPGGLVIMAVKHAEGKSLFDQEKDYYKRIEEMQRDLSEDEKYESKELEGLEASLISLKKLLKINKSDQNAVDAILKDDVPNDVTTLGSADSTE